MGPFRYARSERGFIQHNKEFQYMAYYILPESICRQKIIADLHLQEYNSE